MMSAPSIFVSYARRDGLDYARRLDTDLTRRGFTTWLDSRNLDPDLDFTAELETAIERSVRVVCCVTPDVTRSDSFVRREIGYAMALGKPVVPIIFEDCLPPISIINVTREDFIHTPWDTAVSGLVRRLRRDEERIPGSRDDFNHYLSALYKEIVSLLRQLVFTEIELTVDMVKVGRQASIHDHFEALSPSFGRQRMMAAAGAAVPKPMTLRQAFSVAGRRLLLLGDPGAGKTVSLLAFARDLVAERLENGNRPLPLLAQVFTWEPTSPGLPSWLSSQIPALSEETVAHLIQRKEAILLLDGLDELASQTELPTGGTVDPRKMFLAQLPENVELLVSCRTSDWGAIQENKDLVGTARLCRFDDRQLADYLKLLPVLQHSLEADSQLKELARTPLFLSILTYAYADLSHEESVQVGLGQSPGAVQEMVFDRYVRRRIEHEHARSPVHSMFSEEQIYETLGQVALSQASEEPVIDNLRNLSVSDDVVRLAGPAAAELLECGIVLQLLVRTDRDGVQFSHMLLRRHFGRRACLKRWNYTTSWPDLRYKDDAWQACLAMTKLAWFGDEREVEILLRTANDEDSIVRARGAMALGGIGQPKAAATLCRLLGDRGWFDREACVCDIACWALIQIGEGAIPALRGLIESGADTHVTALVLLILSQMRCDSARQIVEALKADHRAIVKKGYSGHPYGCELLGYVRETTLAELAENIQEGLPPNYARLPFIRERGSRPWTPYG